MTEPTDLQEHLPERRTETSALLVLVQAVHDDVKLVHGDLENFNKRFGEHMATETLELTKVMERLLTSAFPEGDATGHRKHHEAVIAKAEARAAFWRKMAEEITKYGLIGFLGWLAVTAWQAFLQGPHK